MMPLMILWMAATGFNTLKQDIGWIMSILMQQVLDIQAVIPGIVGASLPRHELVPLRDRDSASRRYVYGVCSDWMGGHLSVLECG